jgi:quercetin dioxygenase-like cupin family protein
MRSGGLVKEMLDPVGGKESVLGKAMDLKGLIGYQEHAVVSRTLVDRKEGTVTVFSFDAGEGLSEHTAPFDATVMVLEGEVEITIDGMPHKLREGQLIIMPAKHPHALRALTRFKMMLIMIRGG